MQHKRTWTKKIRPVAILGRDAVITLSTGHEAFVDAEDAALVEGWNWTSTKVSPTGVRYAVRGIGPTRTKLHSLILTPPAGMVADHVDGNGLNCRRANLRLATVRQNTWNRRLGTANTSGYKGVSWRADRGTWLAVFRGRKLGTFPTAEDAARAYDLAALNGFGEFAVLNFPATKFDEVAA